MDHAAALALYLLDKTGSIFGRHAERMPAAQQRELFGRVLGRGRIVIDGTQETVCNRVTVCFGQDYDDRNVVAWRDL